MSDVRWLQTAGRLPKYYHTTAECFVQLAAADVDSESTARGLGMALCPDCEGRERLNHATAESGQPPLRTGG